MNRHHFKWVGRLTPNKQFFYFGLVKVICLMVVRNFVLYAKMNGQIWSGHVHCTSSCFAKHHQLCQCNAVELIPARFRD
jgi:hypothetical protein